ncbi:hypothetical protein J2P12_03700 [Candidatus Bathyarchaeota archaeon]|nr:hypothetical protein [Candidatus Bathyarchaeota archaeon]
MSATSAERKIGLIPRIIIPSRMGPKEYGLLVTDRRSILVLEKDSKAGLAGALGGTIAYAVAQAATTRKSFDYGQEDIQTFALNPRNIVIPHEALETIRMKKAFLNPSYWMHLRFQGNDNKRKKIKAFLKPPGEHVKQKKSEGHAKKQIHLDYAKKVQDVYGHVLSPPRFEIVIGSRL